MMNQWFKFYGGEYLNDTKIALLTASERSCWVTLLCLASCSTKNGVIEFLSIDTLLKKSGIEYGTEDTTEYEYCSKVLETFKKLNMVEVQKNGNIIIKNWENRQNKAMTPYERVKKYRKNKVLETNDNEMITDDNADDNARIEENRIEENRIEKYIYHGEFKNVKLSDDEHQKLISSLGIELTHKLINDLDTYVASKGKKYKSHYATILSWSRMNKDKAKSASFSKEKSMAFIK